MGIGRKRPGREAVAGGGGGERGRPGGEGGEPVDKLLAPLFHPLVINLMIICQQNHYQSWLHWNVNRTHVKTTAHNKS